MLNKLFLSLIFGIATINGANAATLKYTYDFYAGFNPDAPFNPVVGSISIIFDPAAIPANPTLVDSINLTLGSKTYSANETYYQKWGPGLIFGAIAPLNSITGGTTDFMLTLNGILPSAGGSMTYAIPTSRGLYSTNGVAFLLATSPVSSVPLPGSVWFLGSALLALAKLGRREKLFF